MTGEIIWTCWGRADLGQIASCESKLEPIKSIPYPMTMKPLSHGLFVHVWCGSEFTLASTNSNQLWARGWNEHGNLGTTTASGHEWVPVLNQYQQPLQLAANWKGAVATGGAHCLAMTISSEK